MTRNSITYAPINPKILTWARERAGITQEELKEKYKKIQEWENGNKQPTLNQIQEIAHKVNLPIGYFFLSKLPKESLPIPDFRTFAGKMVKRPSPNLLEMIYACQERQSWYQDYARVNGYSNLGFVGSASIKMPPESIAKKIRETIGFNVDDRAKCRTWEDALRMFIRQAEDVGVLVMVSGIVKSNTSRNLDPAEFRGFALSDSIAPLIFINGKDTKSAQMFTLAHELAHIWLGASALSNSQAAPNPEYPKEELWCNAVAAELLVPMDKLRTTLQQIESPDEVTEETIIKLQRNFKVSKLVILRRLLDADCITRVHFDTLWTQESRFLQETSQISGGGGNFSQITLSRVGLNFARALIVSTLEGRTLYRDAFRMLGVNKVKTLNDIGQKAGVIL